MRDVVVRSRADGITELVPRLAPLAASDRLIVIVTVLLVTGGFFVSGGIPVGVAGAIAGSCIVGEIVLGMKAAALALLRPAAQVHEVPKFAARSRR